MLNEQATIIWSNSLRQSWRAEKRAFFESKIDSLNNIKEKSLKFRGPKMKTDGFDGSVSLQGWV